MDFKKLMNSEEYDFLRTNERLGNRIMLMYIEEKHMAPPVLFDDLLKMDIPAELRAAIDELLGD